MTITTVTMTGDPSVDIAAIQTAWSTIGGLIDIKGDLVAPNMGLILAEPNNVSNQTGMTRLCGGGRIFCNGIYASGRFFGIEGLEYSNPIGPGIVLSNYLNVHIEKNYIASFGDGLIDGTVAAAWVRDNQFNGLKNSAGNYGGHGMVIGSDPLGNEFAIVRDNLIEGYVNSFRFQGSGNIRNICLDNNYTDRPQSCHYMFALTGGASVFKCAINHTWANQGEYFVLIDLSQTTGTFDLLIPKIGSVLGGISHPGITVSGGDVSRVVAALYSGTDPGLTTGWITRIAEPG